MDEKSMKIWGLSKREKESVRFFKVKGVLPIIATCDNNHVKQRLNDYASNLITNIYKHLLWLYCVLLPIKFVWRDSHNRNGIVASI